MNTLVINFGKIEDVANESLRICDALAKTRDSVESVTRMYSDQSGEAIDALSQVGAVNKEIINGFISKVENRQRLLSNYFQEAASLIHPQSISANTVVDMSSIESCLRVVESAIEECFMKVSVTETNDEYKTWVSDPAPGHYDVDEEQIEREKRNGQKLEQLMHEIAGRCRQRCMSLHGQMQDILHRNVRPLIELDSRFAHMARDMQSGESANMIFDGLIPDSMGTQAHTVSIYYTHAEEASLLEKFISKQLLLKIRASSDEELICFDIDKFVPFDRKLYFDEVYRRLGKLEKGSAEEKAMLSALKKMTYDDRMAFVYSDVVSMYGGTQEAIFDSIKNIKEYEHLSRYQKTLLDTAITKFDPSWTMPDDFLKAKNLLELIKNHGCSYVACANSILVEFADKPDVFEEKFGFPLYRYERESVVPNFEQLTIDFFCSVFEPRISGVTVVRHTGDPNDPDRIFGTNGDMIEYIDTSSGINVFSSLDQYIIPVERAGVDGKLGTLGQGMSARDLSVNQENYLVNKGIVNVSTTASYRELASSGSVINNNVSQLRNDLEKGKTVVLLITPVQMKKTSTSGYYAPDWNGNGVHDVVVTDIDDDGNLTVSSWGKKYTIPAADMENYDDIKYQTITFRRTN